MKILCLKTDKPDAEIWLYDDNQQLAYISWPAHRELSVTIHKKFDEILDPDKKLLDKSSNFNGASKSTRKNFDKNFGESSFYLSDIGGIIIFKGPGSFTGLRIGFAVANTIAASYKIPIVAASGQNWIKHGILGLSNNKGTAFALPDYGKDANTTTPRR